MAYGKPETETGDRKQETGKKVRNIPGRKFSERGFSMALIALFVNLATLTLHTILLPCR
jgi:hypothetical protein